jgi:hypothetical protein
MTSSPPGPPVAPPGFRFFYGPMAIGFGRGDDAERCAIAMREESGRRGFDGPSGPTEQIARLPLDRFPAVIAIAPSEGLEKGDVAALLRPSLDLAGGYRARRPDGIAAWRAGHAEPYDVGVLQVVLPRDLLAHPAARPLVDKACARHDLGAAAGDPAAIFGIYEAAVPGLPPAPALLGHREVKQLWARVREWGLQDLADVDVVFKRMQELREHYNYDARPALRRPLGAAVPKSRYDYILDGPKDPDRDGQFSTWVPDGAEVVRHAIAELQQAVPTFFNPHPTRGATKRFGRFYQDLRLLSEYVKVTPGAEQMPLADQVAICTSSRIAPRRHESTNSVDRS